LEIHILASGSSGNAALFKFDRANILVDAGISASRLEQGLVQAGVAAGQLDAILISHEHNDHIKGLDVFVRRHNIPVYSRPGTWENIPCRHNLPGNCCREFGDELGIKDVKIAAFNISHDAADPVGFSFFNQNKKIVMATDLGIVSSRVERAMEDADAMVLEANHDMQMLENGPYPRFLKQRIKSSSGHLSNLSAGRLLSRLKIKPGIRVFLAHLSQQNNRPDLAERTVIEHLYQSGYEAGKDIILYRTYPNRLSSVII
jgi:phosphoribosyl 1,2-cyclic phosphodiesterase